MTLLKLYQQIQSYIKEPDEGMTPLQKQWAKGYRTGLVEFETLLGFEIAGIQKRIEQLEEEFDLTSDLKRAVVIRKGIKELKKVLG